MPAAAYNCLLRLRFAVGRRRSSPLIAKPALDPRLLSHRVQVLHIVLRKFVCSGLFSSQLDNFADKLKGEGRLLTKNFDDVFGVSHCETNKIPHLFSCSLSIIFEKHWALPNESAESTTFRSLEVIISSRRDSWQLLERSFLASEKTEEKLRLLAF